MMADAADQAMTVRDVAGYLNVDEKTVYRLAKAAICRVSKWPVHALQEVRPRWLDRSAEKSCEKRKFEGARVSDLNISNFIWNIADDVCAMYMFAANTGTSSCR